MKMKPGKILFLFFLLIAFVPQKGKSQNLTGIWRGYFITENGETYKYELQIGQSKTNRISGVSYSYLDTRFYGKATLSGTFTKSNASALVQEIKTVEVKMSSGSFSCIMKCLLNYSKSGREEFLDGTFSSSYEQSSESLGIKRGGNCGGGTISLRKVPTSDFYIEPFLRDKIKTDTPNKKPVSSTPVKPRPKVQTTATKPQTKISKPTVKANTVTKNKNPKTSTTIAKNQSTKPLNADTIKRNTTPVVIERPKEVPRITIPETTRSRENNLVKTLIVNNEEITIRLYDNGEVDGDTISVYLDGRAVLSNKGLSTVPISLKLKLDENNPEHVVVMVAENMGRIPPNTSLMIVQDGDNRYEVSITSTEQKNAMVRFRYQKK